MISSIILPVHCRSRIVTDIIADPDSSQEQLHSNVLTFPVVDKNSILLRGWQSDGNVCFWFCPQWLQLNPRAVTGNAYARQDFASFTYPSL